MFYTLASWYLRQGQEEAFLRAWRDELAPAFLTANPRARGTLVQSMVDPRQFYSFGPWASAEEMEAARGNPRVREALLKVVASCETATPGPYRVVFTVGGAGVDAPADSE